MAEPPPEGGTTVVLDGAGLTPAAVAAVARHGAATVLDPAARRRNAESHALGERLAAGPQPLYGATTGVGARWDARAEDDGERHALALLRSHAGGAGPLASAEVARALLVVRANQLGAGGAGVSPALLDALVAALDAGLAPAVHELGGIGTGDLTALAEAGLAIAGERPWLEAAAARPDTPPVPAARRPQPAPPPVRFGRRDGLAFVSSNALTIGRSALAAVDLAQRLGAAEAVVALSLLALRGDVAAYDPRAAAARGHPGQVAAAAHLTRLLDGPRPAPVRLQDPLSLRCAPQVCGAARDALADLEVVLAVELNAAAENPLLVTRDGLALHQGNFDTTRLGLSLDMARTALERVAALSVARLAALVDPDRSGLPAFLADAAPASSGILILEYTAHAALAELRATLGPVAAGPVLALGQEDAAPFTPTAARRLGVALDAFTTVVAAEAVAAARALRLLAPPVLPPAAAEVLARLAAALSGDLRDRPLAADVAAASELLAALPGVGG